MKRKLHWRILATISGALIGATLFVLFFGAFSMLSDNLYYQDIVGRVISNIVVEFIGGVVLLVIINIFDSISNKPRTYWFLDKKKEYTLSYGACFFYAMFAPIYVFFIILNYINDVKQRTTTF